MFDNDAAIRKYGELMSQVKPRIAVVDLMLHPRTQFLPYELTIESVALQLRMTLELVAFASLVANREAYVRERAAFAKDWNATDMLKRLERLNANFYPRPVKPIRTPDGVIDLHDSKADYLRASEVARTYGELGGWCHAANPYAEPLDYLSVLRQLFQLRNKLVALLDQHQVRLFDESEFWLVSMRGREDDLVHWARMSRVEEQQNQIAYADHQ